MNKCVKTIFRSAGSLYAKLIILPVAIGILLLVAPVFADSYEIDVGMPAIDRTGYYSTFGSTLIAVGNPAESSGNITTIEIYAYSTMISTYVGTFYHVSGNYYQCRDSEFIGTVITGEKKVYDVNIEIQTGDMIGVNSASTGQIEYSLSGGTGVLIASGSWIDPGDMSVYTLWSGREMSLFGYKLGITEPPSGALSFSLTLDSSDNSVLCEWEMSETASGVRILRDYHDYPSDKDGFFLSTRDRMITILTTADCRCSSPIITRCGSITITVIQPTMQPHISGVIRWN